MKYRIEDWMRSEQARRQQLFTDLFCGRPVDHVPLEIRVSDDLHSVRSHFLSPEDTWLEDSLRTVELTWALGPYTDAIPAFCADVGCSCIANAFGAEYLFLGGEDQTPSVRTGIIRDLDDAAVSLQPPDLLQSPWIREGLRRMSVFAELGQDFTPQCGLDAAGGLNVAADLLGPSALLMAMLTEPEAVHQLLTVVQASYLQLIELEIRQCGGLANMTTTDFFAGWAPMGFKGHCSDDISAMIAPDLYRRFSAPYHAMVYQRYGCGGLHNCGPNPCCGAYMDGPWTPVYLDLNENYSAADLPALKQALQGKGFLRWGSDCRDVQKIVGQYAAYMELLAPDVMLIPTYTFRSVEDAKELYERLLPVAREYAARMEFHPFVRGE